MSDCFGVKVFAESLNEARIERIRETVCKEWEFEEDEMFFFRDPKKVACMLAISMGCPSECETAREFADRVAGAVWKANGRFCPVRICIMDNADVCELNEHDYRRVMKRVG